nr:type II toxin-antitoxin system antitoxin SocA domain-containing protein [Devosia marina]
MAAEEGRALSNMQINKLVYFLHVDVLALTERPLVTAKIEAWEHGPVFRELYSQFKAYGERPVSGRATAISPRTGEVEVVVAELPPEMIAMLRPLVRKYSALSASAMRAESHVEGGPWDRAWNHETVTNASMRISNESILAWLREGWRH